MVADSKAVLFVDNLSSYTRSADLRQGLLVYMVGRSGERKLARSNSSFQRLLSCIALLQEDLQRRWSHLRGREGRLRPLRSG